MRFSPSEGADQRAVLRHPQDEEPFVELVEGAHLGDLKRNDFGKFGLALERLQSLWTSLHQQTVAGGENLFRQAGAAHPVAAAHRQHI